MLSIWPVTKVSTIFVDTGEHAGHDLLTTTDILDEIVMLVRYRLGHAAASALGEKLFVSNWGLPAESSSAEA